MVHSVVADVLRRRDAEPLAARGVNLARRSLRIIGTGRLEYRLPFAGLELANERCSAYVSIRRSIPAASLPLLELISSRRHLQLLHLAARFGKLSV
jgi:hypothetical protein